MNLSAIRTHIIQPGTSLTDLLDQYLTTLKEKSIIAVTSKIVSLCQNRILPKMSVPDKKKLIQQEADAFLESENTYGHYLTIKQGILIPSAGIDESNGNGYYILYPEFIQKTAEVLWKHLLKAHHLKHVGILITDSHTTPLRRGVTGIGLGWCGFHPLYNYQGCPDIFGHPLRVTQMNVLDALASAAVFMMGEGAEQTPIVVMEDVEKVAFLSQPPTPEMEALIRISIEEDIYAPLLSKFSEKL